MTKIHNSSRQHGTYYKDKVGYRGQACALCAGNVGTVYFKGQMVCTDCLDFVRTEY